MTVKVLHHRSALMVFYSKFHDSPGAFLFALMLGAITLTGGSQCSSGKLPRASAG